MLQNFVLLFLFLSFNNLFGQSQQTTTSTPQISTTEKINNDTEEKVMDTNESLDYMADRLLFQVRKRLHLTTKEEEEEEEKEIKKQKKAKLSIGGITIERNL